MQTIGVNGFLKRNRDKKHEGSLNIDGVDISPIEGMYFVQNNKQYLWLKRKPMLVYDEKTMSYKTKTKEPRWECYLTKQIGGSIDYRGTFMFLRFKYSIVGIWDSVFDRLNLYVDRLPINEQTIIKEINSNKKTENGNK